MRIIKHFSKGVLFFILIANITITGCDSETQKESKDTPSPAPPNITVTEVSSAQTSISLNWEDPDEEGLEYIEIIYTGGNSEQTADIDAGILSAELNSLSETTEYNLSIRAAYNNSRFSDDLILYVSTTASGTLEYLLVKTADDMNAIRGGVTGYDEWGMDKHYLLMNDIDLGDYSEDEGWEPLGYYSTDSSIEFSGSFNGNNHVIRNLRTSRGSTDCQALFGYIGEDGSVKNLGITDCNITGDSYTACLAGRNMGVVSHCYTTGSVTGLMYMGGLVGRNGGEISGCNSRAVITGTTSSSIMSSIGGLVGNNLSTGTISRSYSTGSVTADRWGYQTNYTGGLVGRNYGTVTNCYATGDVTAGSGYCCGGLAGENNGGTINICYSIGTVDGGYDDGGLVGDNDGGTITNSFYYQEPENSFGTYSTSSAMRNISTYTAAGWDFVDEIVNGTNDIWTISSGTNNGFPSLTEF